MPPTPETWSDSGHKNASRMNHPPKYEFEPIPQPLPASVKRNRESFLESTSGDY